MYASVRDPYCWLGSDVLVNIPGLRDPRALEAYEFALTRERAAQPLPRGRLSLTHYRAIHRHLFQDVYRWAGQFRTVRIAKEASTFCYPEHITAEMKRLFANLRASRQLTGLDTEGFAKGGAHFLAELNAIHAFREGNGRTQLAFFTLLADRAGHPLRLEDLEPADFLAAMVASFNGREDGLVAAISQLII